MSQKKKCDADDEALFEKYVEDVNPLSADKPSLDRPINASSKKKLNVKKKTQQDQSFEEDALLSYSRQRVDWSPVSGDEVIDYAAPGLQNRLLKQLRQGKLPIESKLDLHQLTVDEAVLALGSFISDAYHYHYRCILVVHGKGYSSNHQKPVLKNLICDLLIDHDLVLAYHSAKAKDGGTGAVYVLLKSKKGG